MSVIKQCPNCKHVHDWSVPCSALLTKQELEQIDHDRIQHVLNDTNNVSDGVDHGHRVGPFPDLSQYDNDWS